MATFPTWINKNKKSTTTTNNANLSPRQIATKAYSLAIKKLDKDDRRRRPQYTVRERLLLSNTMTRAEDVLNKRTTRLNRRVLSDSDDDVIHAPMNAPPPAPFVSSIPVVAAPVPVIVAPVEQETMVTPTPQLTQIKNESPIIKLTQQQIIVSLAVVAVAAYSSLSHEQKSFLSSHDFCRPIMIPSHSMNSITTII